MSLQEKMLAVMDDMNEQVVEREELIEAIAIALLTRKNLFILGAPGQAKSFAINQFRARITGARQFERLLTKQTDEDQLFGRVDLASLIPGGVSQAVLEQDLYYRELQAHLTGAMEQFRQQDGDRSAAEALQAAQEQLSSYTKALGQLHAGTPCVNTTDKIPEADIIMLDEIFKCNDGVLNSLLTALNERKYTNEGRTYSIPAVSFFAASNEVPNFNDPQEKILEALYDRLDLKVVTADIAERDNRLAMLRKKQSGTAGNVAATITLDELKAMQREAAALPVPDSVHELADDILCALRENGIRVSDRKYLNYAPVAQAKAWLSGHAAVMPEDLLALKNYLWDAPQDRETVEQTLRRRYLNGCTLGKIKRELEEDGVPTAQGVERWSPSIIHNILTNEKYIGDALLQKTYVTDCINKKVKKNRGERTMYYVENSHPAIVSRDLFNQVQQEMTRRSSKRKVLQKSGKTELGKYSGKYALTELLVCGECGSPYKRVTWARNGEKRIVWRCVSRLEFGTKYCQHSPTLDEGRLHSAILAAMNEYAAIRQEVCPDVLAMAEEAKQALSQAGARLLQLKKRMDAVSREQSDVLDRLLVNMADTELNARMKALTDEKESLKAQIADAQQAEVNLEEQAARRRQMWDSIMECAAGYTEFDNELVRQVIQKITVEDAETIHIHFRDSDVVLEQEVE